MLCVCDGLVTGLRCISASLTLLFLSHLFYTTPSFLSVPLSTVYCSDVKRANGTRCSTQSFQRQSEKNNPADRRLIHNETVGLMHWGVLEL